MNKFERLQTRLLAVFEQMPDLLEIEVRPEFSVIDIENDRSYIMLNYNNRDNTCTMMKEGIEVIFHDLAIDKLFTIKNAIKTAFIPIDMKNGLIEFGKSRCDFIIFDNYDFCFVEMKLNADSEGERAIRKNRKKAAEQLGNTITFLDEKLAQNYEGLKREAYIATPPFYPRKNASWQAIELDFMEKKGIYLFETNEKKMRNEK